jgi:hypothetical protein
VKAARTCAMEGVAGRGLDLIAGIALDPALADVRRWTEPGKAQLANKARKGDRHRGKHPCHTTQGESPGRCD